MRYFNKKRNTFIVDFLEFSEIYEASAENLYKYFIEFMSEVELNYEND